MLAEPISNYFSRSGNGLPKYGGVRHFGIGVGLEDNDVVRSRHCSRLCQGIRKRHNGAVFRRHAHRRLVEGDEAGCRKTVARGGNLVWANNNCAASQARKRTGRRPRFDKRDGRRRRLPLGFRCDEPERREDHSAYGAELSHPLAAEPKVRDQYLRIQVIRASFGRTRNGGDVENFAARVASGVRPPHPYPTKA